MPAALDEIEAALRDPNVRLAQLEERPSWRHFPHAVLVAAMEPARRPLAWRIGDLLAQEDLTNRLDWHRDCYMWLEAYRLLEPEMEAGRRERWGQRLRAMLGELAKETARGADSVRYSGQFLPTSTNHFALWAATVYLGGKVFAEPGWQALGVRVLQRLVAEQHPDGFWGELSFGTPAIGYNALTLTAVALYWEHSGDPAALAAVRRAVGFHVAYTLGDGQPIDLLNNRNRHWFVSPWGHFAFSLTGPGRRLAEQLKGQLRPEDLTLETLGRLAQNRLYWHAEAGEAWASQPTLPVWQGRSGDWTVTLSGLTGRAPAGNRWFLDQQSYVNVFHARVGAILLGAPAKNQPELASFGSTVALDGARQGERIGLAFDGFVAELSALVGEEAVVAVALKPQGSKPASNVRVALQLKLHAGEWVETGSGERVQIGVAPVRLERLGGWVRHHGWTLRLPETAVLTWPQFGYNPYRAAPDSALDYAVGLVAWGEPVTGSRIEPVRIQVSVP